MDKILVIGACGQLGSELTLELRKIYGEANVIASDINLPKNELADGVFETLDVMDARRLGEVVDHHNITQIYHLAAILSAVGEKKPDFAWRLNMEGLMNVLQLAKEKKLHKVYWPSSIAVFGPGTPKQLTPQDCVMDPNTVYGISKLAGERWCQYYFEKFGVDVRSLRYPGLIGYKALPGGGTTDYAVDIFYKALEGERFECFLEKGSYLPMMYMPDAIKATIDLMESDAAKVKVRSSYNLAAISFAPEDVVESVRQHIPDLEVIYKPDFRQTIADSWPDSIDDSRARSDWGWQHAFDLDKMTADIFKHLPALIE
ncbi:NAD-dependent epimerase/dehydratase family protein [Xanthovirga aplysinae]|uniref:NAD-dependent epimerase/dehydratase family protein n=1 Tax=Xanthovirga aplysinae TaxID=2529853 RepID=UPI0012BBC2E6|nr:NAD-dependent epimerase/dehydratase family protein [Xanthovirga aplysinae]MTI30211.1 NAD-dependent epimerase/dehydratase family protein [Xanthovirga aplysinae]